MRRVSVEVAQIELFFVSEPNAFRSHMCSLKNKKVTQR